MDFTEENFKKLLAENEQLKGVVAQLNEQLRLNFAKLQLMIKKLFGRSSEKLDPSQLLLFPDGEKTAEVPPKAPVPAKRNTGKNSAGPRKTLAERVPKDIPTETVVIIPEEVKANPERFEEIGEETSDELDVTPTQFKRVITVRKKFKAKADREQPPIIAPAPKKLIENSFASVGLVVWIILSKFCDHLPLYRLEKMLKQRYGIDLCRKTMGNWLYLVAAQLAIIYEALRDEIKSTGYMQLDETPGKYIKPGKGECAKGYLWVALAPRTGVLFEWFPSRKTECLDNLLKNYSGLIQSDGYAAYESWRGKNINPESTQTIIPAACWAHARRKFIEVPGSTLAATLLDEIQKIYAIETMLRAHPELDRSTVRLEQAAPILERIKETLEANRPHPDAKAALPKAINYTLNLWDKLTVYLHHSELEIDNNLVENTIRPTAIGKKNHLFFGSETSGQDSAVFYSLLGTCRQLGINPLHYLRDVLAALPAMTNQQAARWTPAQWKARQPAAPAETATLAA